MSRVNRVQKCRKSPGRCGRCGCVIEVGQPYLWWQFFRERAKHVRCTKIGCAPRASELTANEKESTGWALQERFDEFVYDEHEKSTLEVLAFLEELVDEASALVDEYQETMDNIEEHFPDSEKLIELEEQQSQISDFVDDAEELIYDLRGIAEDGAELTERLENMVLMC